MIITLMPTRGLIFTKAQNALSQELMANGEPNFTLYTDNQPIPDCRNNLVETALEIPEWTHALLMDDDVIIPEGGLKRMIDLNTDIAFIDYPTHYTGDMWGKMGTACYDNWLPGQDWQGKEVAWAGLGCCLVKREVFEKLEKPLFKTSENMFSRDENGKITIGGEFKDGEGGGEDVYFMRAARKAGFEIKQADGTCGHARLIKTVQPLQRGKYKTSHKIAINNVIEQPFK